MSLKIQSSHSPSVAFPELAVKSHFHHLSHLRSSLFSHNGITQIQISVVGALQGSHVHVVFKVRTKLSIVPHVLSNLCHFAHLRTQQKCFILFYF